MARGGRKLLDEARAHEDYWQEWIVNDFTEELSRRMEVLGMSRSALARQIGSSPAYITQLLRGEENLTAKTMAKLARAVGSVVRVHLAPVGAYTVWLDAADDQTPVPRVSAANAMGVMFGEPSAPAVEFEYRSIGTAVGSAV